MKGFVQDPQATLDYNLDWSLWLDGDTITLSTWVVESPLVGQSESEASGTTTIFISGGTAGNNYVIANKITTASGRVDERSIELRIRNR